MPDRSPLAATFSAAVVPPAADAVLAEGSWDRTFERMATLIAGVVAREDEVQPIVSPTSWPAPAPERYDVMVVGAGFAGAVMAERRAKMRWPE